MSWWVAGTSFVSGTASAALTKKSKMEQARERRRAGRETLVTAAWNIRERNKWARHTSFEVLDAGTAKYVETAIAGKTAEASAKATAASSGAAVGSGTPRAVLSAIVRDAVDAQTQVLLDTNRNLKALEYDTENQNKSEWRNTNLFVTQQNRAADNEEKAANRQFVADMIETGVSSYGAGATVGGADITKWGSKAPSITTATTKGITTGSSVGSSTFRGLDTTRKWNKDIKYAKKGKGGNFRNPFRPTGKVNYHIKGY